MKVLVTGGTGQVGGALVRALLKRGDTVRCLVRNPARLANLDGVAGVELVAGDVTNPESLLKAVDGFEAVLHAAGMVSYDHLQNEQMWRVNVEGTQNMLDAAAAAGIRRFILTGSIASLGYLPPGDVGNEQTAWNWGDKATAYMNTKRASQQMVLDESRMETAVVMPGIVLGEGDVAGNGLRLLLQLWKGQVPASPPGLTTATTLSDVTQGHLLALDASSSGRAYVLSSWHGRFHDLYNAISVELQCAPPPLIMPPWAVYLLAWQRTLADRIAKRPCRLPPALARVVVRNRQYSAQRAMDELGFQPQPIAEGIRACWQWAQEQDLL